MKKAFKYSLQVTTLMGLALPASASAGILGDIQAQCLCLTRHATVGQFISLGVMLTLVAGIIALKWVYRRELDQATQKVKSKADHAAIETLRELKIGTRFSDWSYVQRLAEQKQ